MLNMKEDCREISSEHLAFHPFSQPEIARLQIPQGEGTPLFLIDDSAGMKEPQDSE